jgi:hypothetical protein
MSWLFGLLALVALLPLPVRAENGAWRELKTPHGARKALADGRADTPNGEVASILRVVCRPDHGGKLCIGMKVEHASETPGFPFAAFQGDDAPASRKPLFVGRIGAGAAAVTVNASAGGDFVSDPPGAFMFESCASNRGPSAAAQIARAIAAGGPVEIEVDAPSGSGAAIRGRFRGDVPDGVVSRVLAGCLHGD